MNLRKNPSILRAKVCFVGLVSLAVLVAQTAAAPAKEISEIVQLAKATTVQINSRFNICNRGGSGVLIARKNDIYIVLTARHVVKCRDVSFSIQTLDRKSHAVIGTKDALINSKDLDLAVVQFKSSENYSVAQLGNSDLVDVGFSVYVSGYPTSSDKTALQREHEFSPGFITSRPQQRLGGYTLRHSATTWGGMSGGPIFDSAGRVVGIHGAADRAGTALSAFEDTSEIPIKTGFNAAIPIKSFLALLSNWGLRRNEVAVDNTPLVNASPIAARLSNPKNFRDYYLRGLTRLDNQNYPGAISDLTQVLRSQPNYAEAYFYQGNAFFNSGNLTKSIDSYSQAIQLNNKYVDAYYNRAFSLSEQGSLREAIRDYTQVIRLDSLSDEAYNNRGLARSSLGDKQGAIDDFNQALKINPSKANTYFNRGQTRYQIRNYEAALSDHTKAIELNPDYAKAYAQRGAALFRLGKVQVAIENLQTAADLFLKQGQTENYKRALRLIEDVKRASGN